MSACCNVAKESRALSAAVRSLIDAALRAPATWADPRHVSQLAVAQQRLSVYFEPFWQRLGANEIAQLGVREAANVLHAYATLVQAGSVPDIDEQLCRRLAGTVAAERKQRAVEQDVANTFWALGIARRRAGRAGACHLAHHGGSVGAEHEAAGASATRCWGSQSWVSQSTTRCRGSCWLLSSGKLSLAA